MEEHWQALRERMVQEQLLPRGIADPRVLKAMAEVPRHLFVPEPERRRAYEDRALSIGHGQTISQPYMVGLMLEALALGGDENVLEIGAGGGYQAALLARLAREVHTVEIVPELAERAQARLESLGVTNVHVYRQDGSGGLAEQAPFDAILVAAAAPEIPEPLLGQLADQGKLLLPIQRGTRAVLTLVHKQGTAFERRELTECAFVPLKGRYGMIK